MYVTCGPRGKLKNSLDLPENATDTYSERDCHQRRAEQRAANCLPVGGLAELCVFQRHSTCHPARPASTSVIHICFLSPWLYGAAHRQALAAAAYHERLAQGGNSGLAGSSRERWHPIDLNICENRPQSGHMSRSTSALRSQLCQDRELQAGPYGEVHGEGSELGRRGHSVGSSPVRGRPGSAGQGVARAASSTGYHRLVSSSVPDFQALHAQWQAQMAAVKAANRKRVTVPEVS